ERPQPGQPRVAADGLGDARGHRGRVRARQAAGRHGALPTHPALHVARLRGARRRSARGQGAGRDAARDVRAVGVEDLTEHVCPEVRRMPVPARQLPRGTGRLPRALGRRGAETRLPLRAGGCAYGGMMATTRSQIETLDPATLTLTLSLDVGLYPRDVLYAAAYVFLDRADPLGIARPWEPDKQGTE